MLGIQIYDFHSSKQLQHSTDWLKMFDAGSCIRICCFPPKKTPPSLFCSTLLILIKVDLYKKITPNIWDWLISGVLPLLLPTVLFKFTDSSLTNIWNTGNLILPLSNFRQLTGFIKVMYIEIRLQMEHYSLFEYHSSFNPLLNLVCPCH